MVAGACISIASANDKLTIIELAGNQFRTRIPLPLSYVNL